MWPGDNYGLALAYFLAGLSEEGWKVMRGNIHHDMLQSPVPGLIGAAVGGTDFNDCVHPFARLVVEGLFGYRPDYPSGRVLIAPQLPWPNATSITTRDVQLLYKVEGGSGATSVSVVEVNLTQAAAMTVEIRISAEEITEVTFNGTPLSADKWSVRAGFGRTIVEVNSTEGTAVKVTVSASGTMVHPSFIALNVSTAQLISFMPPSGTAVVNFSDPQGVLVGAAVVEGQLRATISSTASLGQHMVFAYLRTPAGLPQLLQFKLDVSLARGAAVSQTGRGDLPIPDGTTWSYVDVPYNANISQIFVDGKYVSPRPNTCSARIGTDGYSAW
jgi:hypothetical protein